jgi:hypothetical protein
MGSTLHICSAGRPYLAAKYSPNFNVNASACAAASSSLLLLAAAQADALTFKFGLWAMDTVEQTSLIYVIRLPVSNPVEKLAGPFHALNMGSILHIM